MVRIRAGQFHRKAEASATAPPQPVTLPRDFWLSDREVTVATFRAFMEDEQFNGQRPSDWSGEDKDVGFSPTHPVQKVSWYDAVLFCNWLEQQRRDERRAMN